MNLATLRPTRYDDRYMDSVYLDNNATTRIDDRVVDAMLPFLREQYGNASSLHQLGQYAAHHIDEARAQVAALINAGDREIVFTSGGTEANNLAIRGVLAARPTKRHVVTTAVEHPSVLRLCAQLEREGIRVTYCPVDSLGRLDLDHLADAIDDDTALVAAMHANNETGVLWPIDQIGAITRERNVPLFVDAIQTVGKLPVDVTSFPADLLSIAAHKIHGPKGVGALYIRRGTRLRPLIIGGHQQRDRRGGTEDTAGIVAFGTAATLAAEHANEESTRVAALRDRLETELCNRIDIAAVIGDRDHRLPNTTNIAFAALEAEALLLLCSENQICVSSGSACSSGSLEPSHVLTAMNIDPKLAHGAIRFSLSRYTTNEEIDRTLATLPALIDRLAAVAPV